MKSKSIVLIFAKGMKEDEEAARLLAELKAKVKAYLPSESINFSITLLYCYYYDISKTSSSMKKTGLLE